MVEKRPENIRSMFAAVAPRYDLLNHLLSFSIDRYWRRRTVRKLARLLREDYPVLDLCTGTGDLALALAPRVPVVGCDFCHPMLVLGEEKARQRKLNGRVSFVEGDALRLPFRSGHFQAVTIAFGLRNLEDYALGLKEMGRVLRDRGVLAVLEFSLPRAPIYRQLYLFYFRHVLPRLGQWISGEQGPYSYLPASVQEFPEPGELDEMMRCCGFTRVRHYTFSGGVAVLHLGEKRDKIS